jgi:hypothetical protein
VIKHIPGKQNPADPATQCPNYVPDGEIPNLERTLLSATVEGLKIQGSSLDDPDPRLDIWEVAVSVADPLQEQADTEIFFCPLTKEFRTLLLKAYTSDPPEPQPDGKLKQQDGLWWIQGCIFVPSGLRPRVLQEYHNGELGGHMGALKTMEAIGQKMTWPGIRTDVLKYTKSCFSCQCAKHSNQKSPALMHSLQIPNRPWSCIGIKFMVKLLLSDGFDSILVIVDHFLKGIHLIAALESWMAEEFVYCFFDCFICYHGLPDKIVSD